MNRPLLVIDGDSFAHRSYHALPKSIRRRGNKGGGAIVGFANFLLRLYAQEGRERCSSAGTRSTRRPTGTGRSKGIKPVGFLMPSCSISSKSCRNSWRLAGSPLRRPRGTRPTISSPRRSHRRSGGAARAVVASGDRDAFQLASALTVILQPVRAGEMARIGPAEVRERYGVEPVQVPDFIALRGDSSDKIPGAAGVGPKSAASLLRRYGSLESVLAQGKFANQAEQLRLYRSIATMDASAPLPALHDQRPSWGEAAALAREWELNRLADRLGELQTVN